MQIGDIITLVILVPCIIYLIKVTYNPKIDVIQKGVHKYRVLLWYNDSNGDRNFITIFNNE